MQTTFKFVLDQRVTTPFGADGIVSTCAVDRSGINYYVSTAAGGAWFTEGRLTARD